MSMGWVLPKIMLFRIWGMFLLISFWNIYQIESLTEEQLTQELTNIQANGGAVGFAVGILDANDGLLYAKGFGKADKENDIPYTEDTNQIIASISKTLLGVSLLKAQELGLLSVDDPIDDYLPFSVRNPNYPNRPILIKHLAQHTSSIRDSSHYMESYVFDEEVPPLWNDIRRIFFFQRRSWRSIVELFNQNEAMPLTDFLFNIYDPEGEWYSRFGSYRIFPPGRSYSYSNCGAGLASLIIEQAVNNTMSYTDFVQTHILDPLGMNYSSFSMSDFPASQKTRLYPMGATPIPEYTLITLADGGFVTTIRDFAIYWAALMRGYFGEDNILTAASYQRFFGELLFMEESSYDRNPVYGHTGGDPGVDTNAFFDTTTSKRGYIFFSNTNSFGVQNQAINALLQFENN